LSPTELANPIVFRRIKEIIIKKSFAFKHLLIEKLKKKGDSEFRQKQLLTFGFESVLFILACELPNSNMACVDVCRKFEMLGFVFKKLADEFCVANVL